MKKRNKIVTENAQSKDAEITTATTNPASQSTSNSSSSDEETATAVDQDYTAVKVEPEQSEKQSLTDAVKTNSDSKSAADANQSTAKKPAPDTKSASRKPARSATADKKATPASKAPATEAVPKAANNSGKLALVISIIALGLVGFQYYQTQFGAGSNEQRSAAKIDSIKQALATSVASANTIANQVKLDSAAAISQVKVSLNEVNANLLKLTSAEAQKSADISALQTRLTKSIQQVQASGLQQNSRKDWLLAEVEYLLRLANQRVLMENSTIGALALLESADQILQQTDDVSIFSVRKALAADIAALAAVPHIDQEGLYLKIDALSAQINQLKLVPITDKKKLPKIIDEVTTQTITEVTKSAFAQAWDKASAKLGKLVVINHRDSAIEPLLSPAQQAGLLQNLHILFEQTQLALLQRKTTPYQRSIEKAELIINTYFQAKDGTTQGLLKGLNDLKEQQISIDLPSIAGSLNSLKAYLKQSAEILKAGVAG